ncbi:MAG: hypothetical protein ACOX6T_07900 [Myxococcales bacterium]
MFAGSLWGCGTSLGELEEPQLFLKVTLGTADADPRNPEALDVVVTHAGECEDLASATATINGVGIPESNAGGMESGYGTEHCALKQFYGTSQLPAVDGVVSVRLADGETTFEAEFSGVCDKRTLVVRSPTAPLQGGDEVELEWLPASDVFTVEEVRFESADGRWYKGLVGAETRQEGNRVFFTMPEVPAEAAGKLSLSLHTKGSGPGGVFFSAKAVKCVGASACLASCTWAEPEPIEVIAN